MATIVESLTRDIVDRDLRKEGANLIKKWEKTGLLEGLGDERVKNTMSVLLENQAKELLREASSMSAGDVEGFAAVAFPIVRRVFGGLIANELVSVQPMSLPSGLIFFLDFTYTNERLAGTSASISAFEAGESVYGGGVVGREITGGVSLTGVNAERSFYALNNGYSSATGSVIDTGTNLSLSETETDTLLSAITASDSLYKSILNFDPDEASSVATTHYSVLRIPISKMPELDTNNLVAINLASGSAASVLHSGTSVVRRLTKLAGTNNDSVDITLKNSSTDPVNGITTQTLVINYARRDTTSTSGSPAGALTLKEFLEGAGSSASNETTFTNTGLAGQNVLIPEIDIKVDSIAVTAQTKKLKAKWTPELAQDLNAYHNLDAEVELTGILSEQIALEIDQEILNDLVKGATAGTLYWSRRPGKFVNRETGASIVSAVAPPDFTGNVSEWYETLVETLNDVSARIHRKTLRGGANFVVCSPEVANILEFTGGFRASVSAEELKGNSIGAVKVGSISKKWDVYVDPYFVRNVILIGRRGKAFLESGYVYAPYVPLQVTPTIFGVEDFVPRKGVMTRYAKKMVRPDMYGLVICEDLLG